MKQDLPIRNTSFHPFFFSSRRRHTRCYRHWSSDVCSSDLVHGVSWGGALAQQFAFPYPVRCRRLILVSTGTGAFMVPGNPAALAKIATPRRYLDPAYRSEERRVGKESRSM